MTCRHCGAPLRRLNRLARYCHRGCRSAYAELGRTRRVVRRRKQQQTQEAA